MDSGFDIIDLFREFLIEKGLKEIDEPWPARQQFTVVENEFLIEWNGTSVIIAYRNNLLKLYHHGHKIEQWQVTDPNCFDAIHNYVSEM